MNTYSISVQQHLGGGKNKQRLYAIDGLKTIAMLSIFWWHCTCPNPNVDLGARACEFLYIVSGFLTAYNANTIGTWRESFVNVIRKMSHFFELNCIMMLVAILVTNYSYSLVETFMIVLTNILCIQGWLHFPSYNGAVWFLCPLLACYFLSPMLMKWVKELKSSIILFFVVYFLRLFIEFNNGIGILWNISMHSYPVIKIMEFFLGMLICPLYSFISKYIADHYSIYKKWIGSVLEIITISGVLLLYITMQDKWIRGYFLLCSIVLVFVFAMQFGILSKFLENKFFKLFSKIQMEFFICHQVIIYIWNYFFGDILYVNWIISSTVIFFVTISISALYKELNHYRLKPVGSVCC